MSNGKKWYVGTYGDGTAMIFSAIPPGAKETREFKMKFSFGPYDTQKDAAQIAHINGYKLRGIAESLAGYKHWKQAPDEVKSAALWMAKRGGFGKIGEPLPTNISAEAFEWIEKHYTQFRYLVHLAKSEKNPVGPGPKSKAKFRHERLHLPGRYDKRSFRNVIVHDHTVTLGCRKGHYNTRTGRCDIPMEAQALLHPLRENGCKRRIEILQIGPKKPNPSRKLIDSHEQFNMKPPRHIRKFNVPIKPGDELFEIGSSITQINYVSDKEGKHTEYFHVFEHPVAMFAAVNRKVLIMMRKDGKPFDITDWFYH